jgi:signal transduction histidine kinase
VEDIDLLTDFLRQTLNVSQAKAGALQLVRSEIDLNELVKVMIDLYSAAMAEKGMEIRVRSAGPLKIDGDTALIHRMIGNLIDNEIKHLPQASKVTVRLRADEGLASLVFEDDGPGFPPQVESHLFERRVKGLDSHGYGLGLAFVDAVARAHGGTATASNREEGGARITVTLPLVEENCPGVLAGKAEDPEGECSMRYSSN